VKPFGERRYSAVFLFPVVLLVAGCSGVGTAPPEWDLSAREMKPAEGKALVYIVCSSRFLKAMRVTCDGDIIGSAGARRYLYVTLDPGEHVFGSVADLTSRSVADTNELSLAVEAGRTYFLEQKGGSFSHWGPRLERVSDAEGREKLAKCTLSEDTRENPMTGERETVPAWLRGARWKRQRIPGLDVKISRSGDRMVVDLPAESDSGCKYEFRIGLVYNTRTGSRSETDFSCGKPDLLRLAKPPRIMALGLRRFSEDVIFEASCSDLGSLVEEDSVSVVVHDPPSSFRRELILVLRPSEGGDRH
jgi:hypothetical protein